MMFTAIKRVFLLILGLILIPACVLVTMAVAITLRGLQPESAAALSPNAWAWLIGFFLWVFLFFTMPRPMRTYVLAHELTHALWAYMTGGSVTGMKVSKRGGSVGVTDNNILVTLAPYFFPLYTIMIIIVYGALSLFMDLGGYEIFWLAGIGFTWSFHVTFTVIMLLQHQSDVLVYGRIISYVVIYLLNAIQIGIWIVAVTAATLEGFMGLIGQYFGNSWEYLLKIVEKVQ